RRAGPHKPISVRTRCVALTGLFTLLSGPPMLLLPPIRLLRAMHLVRRCPEATLHGGLGVRYTDCDLVLLAAAHASRRARICFAWCAQCHRWKTSHSGSRRSPRAGCLTERRVPRAGS